MRFLIFLIIFLMILAVAMMSGRYPITLDMVPEIISGHGTGSIYETARSVLFEIRFPRIITSVLVGISLSLAGAVYQGIFKNPMVSPALLGASSGAAFGAALGILFGFSIHIIEIWAFLFGIGAVTVTVLIASFFANRNHSIILILGGILVSTFFTSLISLIKYVSDPYSKLPDITFWLLGSMSSVDNEGLIFLLSAVIAGGLPLVLLRWKINILTLNDEEANSLGLNMSKYRILIIACATLLTSAAVSLCGLVGWVGLVVPHMARMIFGPDYRSLIPGVIIMGAGYLLLIDTITRTLIPRELPLGIVTSLAGAPFFLYLMMKNRERWV